MDQPRKHIAHRFRRFLTEYVDDNGNSVYEEKIQRMAEQNGRSFEVSYTQLSQMQALLALWLADAPSEMLEIFNEIASQLVVERFDRYNQIAEEVNVRITDVPAVETLRDLR
jgi:DNA replication licensing factor MCM2